LFCSGPSSGSPVATGVIPVSPLVVPSRLPPLSVKVPEPLLASGPVVVAVFLATIVFWTLTEPVVPPQKTPPPPPEAKLPLMVSLSSVRLPVKVVAGASRPPPGTT